MQKSDHHEQKLTSPRGLIHKILRRTNSRRSPTAADQQPSPVSPETSNSSIFSKQKDVDDAIKDSEKLSTHTIRIEDEKSDLLGSEIYSGKLTLDNKTKSSSNEQSGSGSSSNCFDARLSTEALIWGSNILKLEDIVSLAGFKMEVVKTTHAGHAKSLVSTIDFSTCPDGIVCVGGDGIVNEVLNGLLCRDDQNMSASVPIGIIPAGSDNSLIWTVLGVKDPISAALSIVRGGLTPIDVFSVEWIQSGTMHYGTTVSYFGFVSDVLELSEKYQKHFGPLRYFVAGFLKFLCLPKYSFELEYLPVSDVNGAEHKILVGQEKVDASDLYDDVIRRSRAECLPRASSLSSIDSIMSTGIMSGAELEVCSPRANNEPSEVVRGLDPKSKRLSLGRASTFKEPEEVLHPHSHGTSTPSWRRSKSKSRTEKAKPGLSATHDAKSSKVNADKEDTSSTISDPGPVAVWDSGPKWDDEPKWDNQPNWEPETSIELHSPREDIELGLTKELVPSLDERWTVRKGRYLGVLVCNHSCKTVQSLSSQVVAPKAEYDDNCLDLLLVGGSGRLRLLRFLVLLQFGKHISLPNVEYVKVKSVRLKAGPNTHDGCGIDGELLHVKGQVRCSLLPQQCQLMGRPVKNPVQ
ncbi:sphingoid long-chain bases kinase 1 isoform X4 [Zea mays]|uniref:Sphingoid long-chain bases kinase 1 n=1 Tax=Zea mays TaxID=4577 RepID=A0A1D6KQR8_MAIZE|nr:sphingoid long-chain bases kinase 1 isoform X4 [Zea mays]ONM05108.1 Sphingoid long-chain bases kinase 1 [Zea mays]|eukprot:XP_020402315.1 sphingoid long-chain bases kinase 1 isoform X4 [Zea mays]